MYALRCNMLFILCYKCSQKQQELVKCVKLNKTEESTFMLLKKLYTGHDSIV